MPSNLFISNTTAANAVQAVANLLNGAFIDLYAGSSQPTDANTNTSASHYILAEVTFSSISGSVVTSTFTAANMVATTATSSGICQFYRVYNSSRALVVIDGSVSTASADMIFNTNNFAQGASLSITSYVLILPEH